MQVTLTLKVKSRQARSLIFQHNMSWAMDHSICYLANMRNDNVLCTYVSLSQNWHNILTVKILPSKHPRLFRNIENFPSTWCLDSSISLNSALGFEYRRCTKNIKELGEYKAYCIGISQTYHSGVLILLLFLGINVLCLASRFHRFSLYLSP